MNRIYIAATASILLVGVFLGAKLFYQQQQAEEAQEAAARYANNLEPEYAATMGDPDARVTIVKFFDPACEACKAFHPLVQRILDENPGKVRLVMRYAPLHSGSDYVSALLEAAKQQGKFWEALEAAYDAQSKWASHGNPQPRRIWMQLGGIGLDFKMAEAAMQSQEVLENVSRDVEEGRQMGINKTPTFYVNGKPLQQFGYRPLVDLVETEIRNAY